MIELLRPIRPIRSFVRREGRMTPGQRRALTTLWPSYGIDTDGVDPDSGTDITRQFKRSAPTIVEIGFGNGQALAAMAAAHPENNYLGIEVHRPGVGSLLLELKAKDLHNVRIVNADAKIILESNIPRARLAAIHLFFPDPWPKARHYKRRLVQLDFAQLACAKLKLGGVLHIATDWEHYAEHMLEVLASVDGLKNTSAQNYVSRPDYRPLTKFELRGQKLGHRVYDLIYQRIK